jgi:hypothetical protein
VARVIVFMTKNGIDDLPRAIDDGQDNRKAKQYE